MSDEMLEFLRARLADDERVALDAQASFEFVILNGHEMSDEDEAHIVRWDPARVLAIIGALRAIVDGFSYEGQETRAVMLLAQALYGEDPEFRDEWRVF